MRGAVWTEAACLKRALIVGVDGEDGGTGSASAREAESLAAYLTLRDMTRETPRVVTDVHKTDIATLPTRSNVLSELNRLLEPTTNASEDSVLFVYIGAATSAGLMVSDWKENGVITEGDLASIFGPASLPIVVVLDCTPAVRVLGTALKYSLPKMAEAAQGGAWPPITPPAALSPSELPLLENVLCLSSCLIEGDADSVCSEGEEERGMLTSALLTVLRAHGGSHPTHAGLLASLKLHFADGLAQRAPFLCSGDPMLLSPSLKFNFSFPRHEGGWKAATRKVRRRSTLSVTEKVEKVENVAAHQKTSHMASVHTTAPPSSASQGGDSEHYTADDDDNNRSLSATTLDSEAHVFVVPSSRSHNAHRNTDRPDRPHRERAPRSDPIPSHTTTSNPHTENTGLGELINSLHSAVGMRAERVSTKQHYDVNTRHNTNAQPTNGVSGKEGLPLAGSTVQHHSAGVHDVRQQYERKGPHQEVVLQHRNDVRGEVSTAHSEEKATHRHMSTHREGKTTSHSHQHEVSQSHYHDAAAAIPYRPQTSMSSLASAGVATTATAASASEIPQTVPPSEIMEPTSLQQLRSYSDDELEELSVSEERGCNTIPTAHSEHTNTTKPPTATRTTDSFHHRSATTTTTTTHNDPEVEIEVYSEAGSGSSLPTRPSSIGETADEPAPPPAPTDLLATLPLEGKAAKAAPSIEREFSLEAKLLLMHDDIDQDTPLPETRAPRPIGGNIVQALSAASPDLLQSWSSDAHLKDFKRGGQTHSPTQEGRSSESELIRQGLAFDSSDPNAVPRGLPIRHPKGHPKDRGVSPYGERGREEEGNQNGSKNVRGRRPDRPTRTASASQSSRQSASQRTGRAPTPPLRASSSSYMNTTRSSSAKAKEIQQQQQQQQMQQQAHQLRRPNSVSAPGRSVSNRSRGRSPSDGSTTRHRSPSGGGGGVSLRSTVRSSSASSRSSLLEKEKRKGNGLPPKDYVGTKVVRKPSGSVQTQDPAISSVSSFNSMLPDVLSPLALLGPSVHDAVHELLVWAESNAANPAFNPPKESLAKLLQDREAAVNELHLTLLRQINACCGIPPARVLFANTIRKQMRAHLMKDGPPSSLLLTGYKDSGKSTILRTLLADLFVSHEAHPAAISLHPGQLTTFFLAVNLEHCLPREHEYTGEESYFTLFLATLVAKVLEALFVYRPEFRKWQGAILLFWKRVVTGCPTLPKRFQETFPLVALQWNKVAVSLHSHYSGRAYGKIVAAVLTTLPCVCSFDKVYLGIEGVAPLTDGTAAFCGTVFQSLLPLLAADSRVTFFVAAPEKLTQSLTKRLPQSGARWVHVPTTDIISARHLPTSLPRSIRCGNDVYDISVFGGSPGYLASFVTMLEAAGGAIDFEDRGSEEGEEEEEDEEEGGGAEVVFSSPAIAQLLANLQNLHSVKPGAGGTRKGVTRRM